MTWQKKVKTAMQNQGMSQKQLAKASGISEASVSYFLRPDSSRRMDVVYRFAKALGVAPEDLLSDKQMAWPEKVKHLMRKRGMNQEQLANASGVSKPSVSYCLHLNRRPDQDIVSRFAQVLGVPPDDLLYDEQMPWQDKTRELMQKQGISQKQMAKACGLSESTVSYSLRSEIDPRMHAIIRFANVLGVSPEDLLSDEQMAWPEKVRTLMRKRGMNQKQLARACGISDSAVSHYLHPKRPKASVAIGLASALDVSSDGLLHDGDTNWRERVKELMRERGMSQRQLARASGISDCSVSYYLHPRRRPKIDVVASFADALGVTPGDLLHDKHLPWQEKVKKLMCEQGMNQRQLAKRSGVSEYSVSHYLHADYGPNTDVIAGFAKALGVTPDYLLGEEKSS